MKRIFLFLGLVLLFLTSNSQTVLSVTATPENVCACDSVSLSFRWTGGSSNTDATAVLIRIKIYDVKGAGGIPNQYTTFDVDTIKYSEIYYLPKNGFLGDTTYKYKVKIPCNLLDKYGSVSGDNTVFNLMLNDKITYNRVFNCLSGIEEYEIGGQKPIYFDLQGNRVDPNPNQLLIEKVGNRRRKIIIQE